MESHGQYGKIIRLFEGVFSSFDFPFFFWGGGGFHCAYARKSTTTYLPSLAPLPPYTIKRIRIFRPRWLYCMSSRIRCLARSRERYRGRGFVHVLPHQSTGSRSRNIGMYTFNFLLSSVSHISPSCSFRSSTNPLTARGAGHVNS